MSLCNQYDFIALGLVNIFCRLLFWCCVLWADVRCKHFTNTILYYFTLRSQGTRPRQIDTDRNKHAMIRQRYAGYQHQQKPYVLPTGENNVKNSMTVNIVVTDVADVAAAAATVVVVIVQ